MTRRGGPDALLFGSEPYAGKTLARAAAAAGKSYIDFLIDIGPEGGSGAHFVMDDALQDVLFTSPLVAISTDGGPELRHPRSTGTYARLLEHYVREKRIRIDERQPVRDQHRDDRRRHGCSK